MATFVSRIRYELLPLATVQLPREFPWWGLLVCLLGKSPTESRGGLSLGDDTRGGLEHDRRGLWAAGVLLLLVGLVGVLALSGPDMPRMRARQRSALRPRSTGRTCSLLMELESRAMSSSHSPTRAMRSL